MNLMLMSALSLIGDRFSEGRAMRKVEPPKVGLKDRLIAPAGFHGIRFPNARRRHAGPTRSKIRGVSFPKRVR